MLSGDVQPGFRIASLSLCVLYTLLSDPVCLRISLVIVLKGAVWFRIVSLLPPCEFWGLNWGYQVWQKAFSPLSPPQEYGL